MRVECGIKKKLPENNEKSSKCDPFMDRGKKLERFLAHLDVGSGILSV